MVLTLTSTVYITFFGDDSNKINIKAILLKKKQENKKKKLLKKYEIIYKRLLISMGIRDFKSTPASTKNA